MALTKITDKQVTYKQGASGSEVRSLGDKLRESVSILDFDIDNTGVADASASGTWARGDICWNTAPSAGGTPGWVCVTAGTSGTWKAMANLAT